MKDGLLDRVARIEQTLGEFSKTISAIARVVGPGEVQVEMALAAREEMEQAIVAALKEGQIVPGAEVGESSLIVGSETLPDGRVVSPGRFQFFVKDLAPEVKAQLLGKVAGDAVTVANGNIVKVSEIYEQAAPEPKKAPKKRASKKKAPPAPPEAT